MRAISGDTAIRLYCEGRVTGPPESVSQVIRHAKKLQIACRFPNVHSREEAIEWAKRAPMSNNEKIEVRQIHARSDFPEDIHEAAKEFEQLTR